MYFSVSQVRTIDLKRHFKPHVSCAWPLKQKSIIIMSYTPSLFSKKNWRPNPTYKMARLLCLGLVSFDFTISVRTYSSIICRKTIDI